MQFEEADLFPDQLNDQFRGDIYIYTYIYIHTYIYISTTKKGKDLITC